MKVVADTNILVSAIIFGGNPQAVLDLAQEGQIELFVSDAILAETARIFRDKFHRTAEELRSDMLALEALTTRVQPVESVTVIEADPTDDRILECAVTAGAERIVSGGRAVASARRTTQKVDFSDTPEASTAQLSAMRRVGRPSFDDAPRQLIAIRVDAGVLQQFRKEARRRRVGYQTLINEVLAKHARSSAA